MTTASCQRLGASTSAPRGIALPVLESAGVMENPLGGVGITGPRDLSAVEMLRISVTDVCNLRCVYCMPEEGVEWLPKSSVLSFEEIATVVRAAAGAGITHFKLTGGEPTARRDLAVLVRMLRQIDGVEDLSLTTNGILLLPLLEKLKVAGLDRLTISIDSLKPEKFREITRGGDLKRVWAAIEGALAMGFKKVKLNVVAMRGINEDEVADFAGLTLRMPVTVRFIEFMPLGRSGLTDKPEAAMVTEAEIRAGIEKVHGPLVPVRRMDEVGVGPANVWKLAGEGGGGAVGKVGFISAMSHPFCETCNRLRLTPDGLLRSCLFDGGEVDLKEILRANSQEFQTAGQPLSSGRVFEAPSRVRADFMGHSPKDLFSVEEQLISAFARCVTMKPKTHSFTGNKAMNRIGG